MSLEDRHVLVTGANGFVGGRVARRLADAGAGVVAMVRRRGAADVADGTRITELVARLTDAGEVRDAVGGCDAVVHCAATTGDDWDAARDVNRYGTRHVAEAALEAGVARLVHISTTSVYARADREMIDEDTPMVVEGDPYGVTKAEAEREVLAGIERGLDATILRPPAVLGWAPTSTWGQRFPSMLADGALPFARHPDQTYPWVHVDDLADAVVAALADERAAGRTYNVVGGHATWRDYLDALTAIVGAPAGTSAGSDGRPPWTGRIDGSRITAELGVRPHRTFAAAMQESTTHWTP